MDKNTQTFVEGARKKTTQVDAPVSFDTTILAVPIYLTIHCMHLLPLVDGSYTL